MGLAELSIIKILMTLILSQEALLTRKGVFRSNWNLEMLVLSKGEN